MTPIVSGLSPVRGLLITNGLDSKKLPKLPVAAGATAGAKRRDWGDT